jgi:hypothetical protein
MSRYTRDHEGDVIRLLQDNDTYPPGDGGGGTWGSITGTLSDQADLQTALDAKWTGTEALVAGHVTLRV